MDLQIFTSQGGRQIRTLLIDGDPWFVAADVALILGYRMASDMTRRLGDDDKGTRSVRTPSGSQEMTIISEPGLYAAIFGSQIPDAQRFKTWVMREVLPAIRKQGGYQVAPTTRLELARMLLEAEEKAAATEKALEAAQPAIEFFQATAAVNEETGFQETSKILGVNHHAFMRYLKEERIVRALGGKTLPAHYPISMGYMVERTTFSGHLQAFFTDKGRKWIRSKTEHLPRIAPSLELVA